MSELNELIQKLCPDGVEYKKISDLYTRLRGTSITAGKMKEIADENGDIRIFAGGKTAINAFEKDIPKANITRVPAVLVQSRGVIDFVYYDKPFTFKNEMWAYTHENTVSVKYLYYVLKNNVQEFRNKASIMGSMPQISLRATEDFEIPLPPLPVQAEVVRILDAFTELEAELEAELADRIEQYEYFRARLFDDKNLERMDGGKIEHDTVNSLVDVITPTAKIKKNEYKEAGLFPVIDQGMNTVIAGYTDNANALPDNEWILFGDHTCSLKYFDGRFVQGADGLKILKAHDNVLPKFVFYALKNLNVSSNEYARHWTSFKKNELPVPSLATQERIVDILDRFDTLTTSLTDGIPAEIAMRREQYEYWRSRILDFPRLPDDFDSNGE